MSDPRRWLDDKGEASGLEREILGAGVDVDPPEDAHAAVWAALATKVLPPVGGGGLIGGGVGAAGGGAAGASGSASAGGAAATAAASGASAAAGAGAAAAGTSAAVATGATVAGIGGVKLAIVAVAIGGAGVATYASVAPPRPDTTTPAATVAFVAPAETAVATTPSTQATAPQPEATAEPTPEPPAASSAAASPVAPSAKASAAKLDGEARAAAAKAASEERASRIKEEMALITQARNAYHAGNAAQALKLLDEAAKQFPDGTMGQEREKLTIEALAASGNRAAARARAENFLKAYPKSPFASRVQAFLE